MSYYTPTNKNAEYYDVGRYKHPAKDFDADKDPVIEFLLKPENIRRIQEKTTELLSGVRPDGMDIVVSEKVIASVLSQIYNDWKGTNVGSIYSRYIQNNEEDRDDIRDMTDMCIEVIVNNIRNEVEIEDCNKNLSLWNSIRGDFNKNGLMPHDNIKLNRKRPSGCLFNMNY
jgi:hypothetical protein